MFYHINNMAQKIKNVFNVLFHWRFKAFYLLEGKLLSKEEDSCLGVLKKPIVVIATKMPVTNTNTNET